jgi:hypothetical protein
MEERAQIKGIFDLINRIARVLLNKPGFKANLALLLNHIDPDSVPDLVRTLIWEDVGVALSLADAVPKIANALIKAAEEAVTQVNDHFPPEFLREVIRIILAEIDFVALMNVQAGFNRIMAEVAPLFTPEAPDTGVQTMPEKGGQV